MKVAEDESQGTHIIRDMRLVTENIAEMRNFEVPTKGFVLVDINVGEQISFSGVEKGWVSLGTCFEIVILRWRENIQEAEDVVDNFCRNSGTHGLWRRKCNEQSVDEESLERQLSVDTALFASVIVFVNVTCMVYR